MDLICRFVVRNGEVIGESIDVHKNRLVIKVKDEFLGIPLEAIEKTEEDKIYVSEFNEEDAKRFGEIWLEEKSKPVSLEELKSYGFGGE